MIGNQELQKNGSYFNPSMIYWNTLMYFYSLVYQNMKTLSHYDKICCVVTLFYFSLNIDSFYRYIVAISKLKYLYQKYKIHNKLFVFGFNAEYITEIKMIAY